MSSKPKVGSGLVNMGNTCFMNSVLQCLTYTVPLQKFFTQKHSDSCKRAGFCPVCALEFHIKKSLVSKSPFTPKQFVLNLKKVAKHFRHGRQEDSHEFLRFLIDGMHAILKNKKKHSPIEDIFGGLFQSQVTCQSCKTKSSTLDPIMDISLDIKNCDSVEQAFYRYTSTEDLVRDNQYKCEKCKKLRDAKKKITIKKTPLVLTIQLKRFGFQSYRGSKVTRHIKYPDVLNVGPFSSDKTEDVYCLYGVLVHAGHTCNSGHYYAFIKSGSNWYRMDDESTQPVPLQTVLSQSAYLLFYQKKVKGDNLKKQNIHASKEKSLVSLQKENTESNSSAIKPLDKTPLTKPEVTKEHFTNMKATPIAKPSSDKSEYLDTKSEVTKEHFRNMKATPIAKPSSEKSESISISTKELISRSLGNAVGKERTIEFVKPSEQSLPSTPVCSKPTVVKSTSKWATTPIVSKEKISIPKVNSTVKFSCRPIVRKLTDFVAGLEDTPISTASNRGEDVLNGLNHLDNAQVEFSEKTETQTPHSKEKETPYNHSFKNKKHHTELNGDVEDGRAFQMSLKDQLSKTEIRPWNHMATSEAVFQRNQIIQSMEQQNRRKRPSRDDMEYDAPLLKGLKKKQRKMEKAKMR